MGGDTNERAKISDRTEKECSMDEVNLREKIKIFSNLNKSSANLAFCAPFSHLLLVGFLVRLFNIRLDS